MATLPDGAVTMAVTPSNFEEIIAASKGHPFEEAYTEERLKEIRARAREQNAVAFVCFLDDAMWDTIENPNGAVHDTGDWRGDRF